MAIEKVETFQSVLDDWQHKSKTGSLKRSYDTRVLQTFAAAEGRIFVFDAYTREQTHVIDMPKFGDPHGLVWIRHDEEGNSMVIRDQGGFHNGVNPMKASADAN